MGHNNNNNIYKKIESKNKLWLKLVNDLLLNNFFHVQHGVDMWHVLKHTYH